MIKGNVTKERMETWKHESPKEPGFHCVISPKNSDCEQIFVYRLNLTCGQVFTLKTEGQEMNPVCVAGMAMIRCEAFTEDCHKLDSFYVTGNMEIQIEALEDCIFYIGAAVDEGYGKPFFRKCDLSLPIGEIHQIHGKDVGQREVFMTVNPEVEASRLLCGLTWGGNGSWTSWPPHQHEKDLEEVYCYFDIEPPHFGLHLSYVESGNADSMVASVVTSGTFVLAPRGYHPTVAAPGTKNTYLWILAAHSHKSRRYDLAVPDPFMEEFN